MLIQSLQHIQLVKHSPTSKKHLMKIYVYMYCIMGMKGLRYRYIHTGHRHVIYIAEFTNTSRKQGIHMWRTVHKNVG